MSIKLSDAILAGSLLRPQAIGTFGGFRDGQGSCALAAAIEGAGLELKPVFGRSQEQGVSGVGVTHEVSYPVSWHDFLYEPRACPICREPFRAGMVVLAHLNDKHLMSRPEVAAWVAEQERALEAQSAAPAEAVEVSA